MITILGILVAVIIPNAAGFMVAGRSNAANTEVANVKTAATGYMAKNEVWPTHTGASGLSDFYDGTLKATYSFDSDGMIDAVDDADSANPEGTYTSSGWDGITFNPAEGVQKWERT